MTWRPAPATSPHGKALWRRGRPTSGENLAPPQVSFKTQLDNALIAESEVMTDTFGALEAKINQSPEFGAAVLGEAERRYGRPGMDDNARELVGRQYLDEFFNKIRKYGFDNWFYYGNDPETHNSRKRRHHP